MDFLVREHCNIPSCDLRRLIGAIRGKYVNALSIANQVWREHQYVMADVCHICGDPTNPNPDHYSCHVTSDVYRGLVLLNRWNCRY